jgi:predicted permease
MRSHRVFASRLLAIVGGRRRDADLNDEIQAHLDTLTDDYVRRGLSPADARAAARRDFGGVDQVKEVYRDQRSLPFVETLAQDVRYALRALRASPGFAAAAILSLALGIGGNSAVFTLVNAALMRDLPVEDPDRLATVYWRNQAAVGRGEFRAAAGADFSYPIFRELASRQRVFSDMAASGNWGLNRITLDGETEDESAADVDAGIVSANYFSMLGVRASLGRAFGPDDSRAPGEGAFVVLGDGFWSRRFGRDPGVLGRTMFLNNVLFTIIGVMPRGFFGDRVGVSRDFWVPLFMQPRLTPASNQLERRTAVWFRTIGRLKPGVTDAQATTELTALFRQSLADEIASGSGTRVGRVNPADARVYIERGSQALNTLRARVAQPLMVLLGVVGLVLLIACGNVANLLLARASARQREIGIRLAMGASRRRLVRQLMTESLVIAVTGGVAGLILAQATSELLARTLSMGVLDLRSDSRVLTFTLLASAATTLVFGLVPALQATNVEVAPTLQSSSITLAGGRPRRYLGRALVVVQVGLTLWVLIGAGLLVRTLQNMRTADIGIDRTRVMTVAPLVDPGARADVPTLRRTLSDRLKAVPGIDAVGFSTGYGLFLGSMNTAPVRVPDSTVNAATDRDVGEDWISPEYFRTVGMTLVRGRAFQESDTARAPRVAIVNETTARHYFGDRDPLGRLIYFPKIDAQNRYVPFAADLAREDGTEIVGVVRDARDFSLRQPARKMAFLPLSQRPESPAVGFGNVAGLGVIHLRVVGDSDAVAARIRELLPQVHPGLRVRRVSMLDADIERTLGRELMMTRLVGFFGLLALLLACVGLYGVMSYTVARRTGEIGVRMALGARQTDVAGMMLRDTAGLVIGGIGLGIPAALATTRLIASLLFGLEPTDPATIGVVTLVMLTVAGLAGLLPARRAAKVDPMIALRHP